MQRAAERAAGARREELGLLSSLLGSQLAVPCKNWAGFNPGLSRPRISGLVPLPGRGRGVPRPAQPQIQATWVGPKHLPRLGRSAHSWFTTLVSAAEG